MGGFSIESAVTNLRGAPGIGEWVFAEFPANGATGFLAISTDTFEIYRWNGTDYDRIGGPGSAAITGTGTAGTIAKFGATNTIEDSNISQDEESVIIEGGVIINGDDGTRTIRLRAQSATPTTTEEEVMLYSRFGGLIFGIIGANNIGPDLSVDRMTMRRLQNFSPEAGMFVMKNADSPEIGNTLALWGPSGYLLTNTTALPDGTTGTTQSSGDDSDKVATTAFVQAASDDRVPYIGADSNVNLGNFGMIFQSEGVDQATLDSGELLFHNDGSHRIVSLGLASGLNVIDTDTNESVQIYTNAIQMVTVGSGALLQADPAGSGVLKTLTLPDQNGELDLNISGSFSDTGAATTVFTVTIGSTQPGTDYKVIVTPTNALSAALFYVDNKTTTEFDVVYLAGLTGTVAFDWKITR